MWWRWKSPVPRATAPRHWSSPGSSSSTARTSSTRGPKASKRWPPPSWAERYGTSGGTERRRTSLMALKACHSCGLIHRLPPLENEQAAACVRCGTVLHRPAGARRSAARTAAAALGALALFWPAILLPVLEIEQLGHRYQSSILWGTIELLRKG